MHRAWRGRAAAAALALTVAGVLVGCNPPPGAATLTVTGAVEAENPEGTVTCLPSGSAWENRAVPTWEWNGTIDGQAATFEVGATFVVGSPWPHVPDEATLSVGNRTWEHLTAGSPGEVVTDRVDHDGTLHVTATLYRGGGEEVQITAALRCPSWGSAEVSGFVTGTIDGTATCRPPSWSNRYTTFEIITGNLEGRLDGVMWVTFEGVDSPDIHSVHLQVGPVAWTAANFPGEPPDIEIVEQQADRLVVRATLTASGLPGIELEATVTCS